jgi:methylamine---glutamate N-methyltransferase subunit A
MCGIAGIFSKSETISAELGSHLAAMLLQLAERGPDSVGVALYRDPAPPGSRKLTLHAPAGSQAEWDRVRVALDAQVAGEFDLRPRGRHAVLVVGCTEEDVRAALPVGVRLVSAGAQIEIYKEAGSTREVLESIGVRGMSASHGLGHTRMATESRVTTEHSHPFSTGQDVCLVHNGSLSNHNRLRERLRRAGVRFETDNDSEVAAGYLASRLGRGETLEVALEACLRDLDGFFTFAVGTADGFAVLRDPIACKPAVIAETDDWVAMASEYRAIATLPGAADATVWEPDPARVYSWGGVSTTGGGVPAVGAAGR